MSGIAQVTFKRLTQNRIDTGDPADTSVPPAGALKDGAGNLLTSANALCKVTITANTGNGAVLIPAITMTYSTPGYFYYDAAPVNFQPGQVLLIQVMVYDSTGATLNATYDALAYDGG